MPLHGHLRSRTDSVKSNRSSHDEQRSDSVGAAEDDTTVVEPDQNNVLSHIISQLRPGADLSRITLPTFILEERSMLERITNFMAHPETLLAMPKIDDPIERFVSVVKFYLSGWHIRPPGVKKPLNPILGETFTCYWDYPDRTRGYYIAEQTSHHPPKSSYFFMAPDHNIRVDGTLKPRSKFLGNSAGSMMEGISYLRFTNRGNRRGGEKYILTQPNMYARGILFGKMKYELGDHSFVRCPENNLTADIEFKVKGYISGTYNAIGGVIKNEKTKETLFELSGFWSGEMYIKNCATGKKELLFDATHARPSSPLTRPIREQGERESQRLWASTVKAVHARDHEKATEEKTKIEDRQREEASKRAEQGIEWKPLLFRKVKAGPGESEEGEEDLDWILNADINAKDPRGIERQILAIAPILPGPDTSGEPQVSSHAPAPHHPPTTSQHASSTPLSRPSSIGAPDLIDFGHTTAPRMAPTEAEPVPGPTIPTKEDPPKAAGGGGLMDDDSHVGAMNEKMRKMKLMEPIRAEGGKPLKRLDTESSDAEDFFDAEG